jgi:ElaB/YqjD/DUF883 family membrane-anchored ribosome-binding protein
MAEVSKIKEHMEVIGADGVHIGRVDRLEGNRIKLAKGDSGQGSHKGHHHFIPTALVADVEGNRVRLSANADVAVSFEEEAGGRSTTSARSGTGEGAQTLASSVAGAVQEGASKGYRTASEVAAHSYDAAAELADRGYRRARELVARTPSLSEEIAERPLLAVSVAALLGVLVGWALRGSSEPTDPLRRYTRR